MIGEEAEVELLEVERRGISMSKSSEEAAGCES